MNTLDPQLPWVSQLAWTAPQRRLILAIFKDQWHVGNWSRSQEPYTLTEPDGLVLTISMTSISRYLIEVSGTTTVGNFYVPIPTPYTGPLHRPNTPFEPLVVMRQSLGPIAETRLMDAEGAAIAWLIRQGHYGAWEWLRGPHLLVGPNKVSYQASLSIPRCFTMVPLTRGVSTTSPRDLVLPDSAHARFKHCALVSRLLAKTPSSCPI